MTALFRKHSAINPNTTSTQKTLLEATGVCLAMLIAALLGTYVARIATRQIDSTLTKFIVGIVVGLLVGIAVGFIVKRIWDPFKTYLLKNQIS